MQRCVPEHSMTRFSRDEDPSGTYMVGGLASRVRVKVGKLLRHYGTHPATKQYARELGLWE